MSTPVKPLPQRALLSRDQWLLYRQCKEIKDKYADGVPLNKADRKLVLTALRCHPKGREKFGAGVDVVVVNKFIGGTRCFFVVRADGTAEDFSLNKCFWMKTVPRSERVAMAMKRFNYRSVVQKILPLLTRPSVNGSSSVPEVSFSYGREVK